MTNRVFDRMFPDVHYEIEEDDCSTCGGDGLIERDCFEDTCCCADPIASHGLRRCPDCNSGRQQ